MLNQAKKKNKDIFTVNVITMRENRENATISNMLSEQTKKQIHKAKLYSSMIYHVLYPDLLL